MFIPYKGGSSIPSYSRRMILTGHVARMGDRRAAKKDFVARSEEKRSLGRRRRGRENINTLRTGAFKLFKCTFPGSKQFKSTLILCLFKNL